METTSITYIREANNSMVSGLDSHVKENAKFIIVHVQFYRGAKVTCSLKLICM